MKKNTTTYYKFTKPKGTFFFTGMYREWEDDAVNMSYDIEYLYEEFSFFNREDFSTDLLNFVEKHNNKLKKAIKGFVKEDFLDIIVNIKPSGITVEYNPVDVKNYPKKEWNKFYGKFKINKVDMLKFLNNYTRKHKILLLSTLKNKFKHHCPKCNTTQPASCLGVAKGLGDHFLFCGNCLTEIKEYKNYKDFYVIPNKHKLLEWKFY